MRNIIIWSSIFVVLLAVLIFWGAQGTKINPPFEVGIVHPLDNVKGKVDSKVVITEYSDFQCPACRTYYSILRQLMVEFGDQVAFVYRHFPLNEIHANAEFAARASQAAGKQGKFWEMHDLLFEKQDEWSNTANIEPLFESYATLLGISVEQFKTDWLSKETKDFVRAQRVNAIKIGLQATPSFFVNGEQIKNPTSVDEFRLIIQKVLQN